MPGNARVQRLPTHTVARRLLGLPAQVVDVCCGSGSLYALTDGGDVFAWGQGGQGALSSRANHQGQIRVPRRMQLLLCRPVHVESADIH